GLWAELDYLDRSIKAQMKAANRLSSKYAMIFGEEELGRNRVILRNMRDGHEQEMDLQELEQLAKIIGECGQ
ncbi:MAG: His/Gly/Thr/Pro-type tRNA ligase C-terminal domain-containing protein, partial [Limnochordia bacterium]